MKYLLILSFLFVLYGCSNKPTTNETKTKPTDEFYHYSLWAALINKIYDGNLTVKEARTHGDIGLGTYNGADGELIMLDGILYQVPSTGEVKLANDSMHIPYLNTTFFQPDISFEIADDINYDSLRKLIQQHFPSRNFFYAFKIHGEFDSLKLGSMHKQNKPYQVSLDSLLPHRPTFDRSNVTGTMVGFYCPDFIGDINVAGFHLHFLSDDKKAGGHVLEFTGSNFKVEIDKLSSYRFVLPETDDFDKVNLEKKFQYG
ncbi:MAG: acetolactate decarboxylase, partial [Bacteroidia bacterium]|nr:acetolactate decarboxylase [Bacteroidia bacterium]